REIPALFMVFDELPRDDDAQDSDLVKPLTPQERLSQKAVEAIHELQELQGRERHARHTINGLAFGNLTGLDCLEGERVRWHLLALGREDGVHTVHWHGARVLHQGSRRTDVVDLLPGSAAVADMVADNPGNWLLECHVSDHMMHGMYTSFTIHSPSFIRTNFM